MINKQLLQKSPPDQQAKTTVSHNPIDIQVAAQLYVARKLGDPLGHHQGHAADGAGQQFVCKKKGVLIIRPFGLISDQEVISADQGDHTTHTRECVVLRVGGLVLAWLSGGPTEQQGVRLQASDADALDQRVHTAPNLTWSFFRTDQSIQWSNQ
jgi:hypothetical protein